MSDKHGPQGPVRQDREHQTSLLYLFYVCIQASLQDFHEGVARDSWAGDLSSLDSPHSIKCQNISFSRDDHPDVLRSGLHGAKKKKKAGKLSRKSLHRSNLSSSLLSIAGGENYIKPHFCHILPLISLVGGKATEYRWLWGMKTHCQGQGQTSHLPEDIYIACGLLLWPSFLLSGEKCLHKKFLIYVGS